MHEARTRYEPTRRACLREARRRRSRLRKTFRQDRFPRSPAKRSAIGRAQGAFHRGPLSRRCKDMIGEPAMASGISGEVGGYPHVVPNLWKSRQRLFNPCRWSTLRRSVSWQRARTRAS